MSKKTIFLSLITLLVLFFMYSITFARTILGQVVDAETGKPIENAAFFIHWWKETGLPGLTSGSDVETADGYTDAEGYFKIPKYSTFSKKYRMAIYKKGYVCWRSDYIFPTWEKRKDFKLKNKMVIKLESFRKEYSKLDHAMFTNSSALTAGPTGIYDKMTEPEGEIEGESFRTNKGE
jgi:hypothetical protein